VELGLGASSPAGIHIITDDEEGESYAQKIREILIEKEVETVSKNRSKPQ
jgi:hypothetical protein